MAANLQYYLDHWNLSDPQPLAETYTSFVYTVCQDGETAVLKLLKPVGEEERSGALALRYFDGLGAIHLLRDDDGAHLLEYTPGDDLVPIVKAGQDEAATAIIARVLNQLHQPREAAPQDGLHMLNEWFVALFDKAVQDQAQGKDSIFRRGAAVAEHLHSDPRDVRVLHGDIHHENIRWHDERGWLAIDPKGLYGDRHYDAANTFYNPDMRDLVENTARIRRTADILAQDCGFDRQRLLAFVFAYGCLSAAWSLEEDWGAENAAIALRVAALAEAEL